MTNSIFDASSLYDIYQVKIRLRDKLCGGMPKNPELIKAWVESTTGHADATTEAQTKEAIEALVDEVTERSWNGFPADAKGIFVWARQVKALFKECASMLRVTVDKRGSKQIFQHGFEIKGPEKYDRVYLGKTKADGYDEGPIHVQTAQGPRTALKRVDYVENVELVFDIWVLAAHPAETRYIGKEDLERMLTFAQENGLGADRSQGRGKFDVLDFKVLKKVERKKEETEVKTKAKGKKGKAEAETPDSETPAN